MPAVDLVFPTLATRHVPLDHGYLLFSALSATLPRVHAEPRLGIFNLRGRVVSKELLDVSKGLLRIRSPGEAVPELVRLAGTSLELAGVPVRLGVPSARLLQPVAALSSRVVTIKGFMEEAGFAEAARRHLSELGCQGEVVVGRRRVVRIAGKGVVGFSVDVLGLSADHSQALQEAGLGGRRHMGCGLFLPRPENRAAHRAA